MAIFGKTEKTAGELDKTNLPRHIAIILDGNGRWAKKRGMVLLLGLMAVVMYNDIAKLIAG